MQKSSLKTCKIIMNVIALFLHFYIQALHIIYSECCFKILEVLYLGFIINYAWDGDANQ